jgi:hypothetical protein
MLSLLLIAVAAALMFGVDAAKVRTAFDWCRSRVDPRTAVACAIAVIAVLLLVAGDRAAPTPPPDDGPLTLRGEFVGPTASDDAATIGALLTELADELEYDGRQSEPAIRTGVQVDQLRTCARTLRCRGESIGDRQPRARDKIASYLLIHVGEDGGPLTDESRAAWVSAFRDAGRAASEAAK